MARQIRPVLILKEYEADDPNDLNITEYVADLRITHEQIDADGAGRDVNSGDMERRVINVKHTYEIKLLPVTADLAKQIYGKINGKPGGTWSSPDAGFYWVTTLHPCTNALGTLQVYTSAINYGSQVYEPSTGEVWYRGMSFKAVEK